ncbi:iron-containing alcohol dehydrogenase [Salidesulfovibrio brasiliensis]|uniref:iron-containing alcohol dehydrogenase n=1 Tax=Salidesulfovibrio brasiliensis TaxID=221711 RepID=UPI0006CFD2E9|nr:iron-containing alcohol dehydrogenase [Salidesulfovibrio brasiliensis]
MRFTFSAPGSIIFGRGRASQLAEIASARGDRACVVTGANPKRHSGLVEQLEAVGLKPLLLSVAGEPDTQVVMEMTARAREAGCDVVVGIGGGSVMDAGKAVSALLTNEGELLDYLEVVGKGHSIAHRPAPYIAVPTTAGTGAEATANAVLLSPEHGVKVSMRSHMMISEVALVDPELSATMPPSVTAATGMDALTQLLEALVSKKATPMTDPFCRDGLARAADALPRAYHDPDDMQAREDMAYASLLSGMALANAGLGAVHGFAAPIGGRYKAPHGAVCAALLPHVMEVNIRALRERDSGSDRLAAYAGAAWLLCGSAEADVDDGVAMVADLCRDMAIPTLGELGMAEADIAPMVDAASKASSMRGNPVELTRKELQEILERAL